MTINARSRAAIERIGLADDRTFPTSTTAPVQGVEEGEVDTRSRTSSGGTFARTRARA
jgi:hypothetical protein